jgi:hypothetical protein
MIWALAPVNLCLGLKKAQGLNRLQKKVEQRAKTAPSAAKAALIL